MWSYLLALNETCAFWNPGSYSEDDKCVIDALKTINLEMGDINECVNESFTDRDIDQDNRVLKMMKQR
jgi:hypothetical protein